MGLREPLRQLAMNCSLPAALEAMGERWSFLILRASFNGFRHFEEFQGELGIARNILANRLGRLVDHGILQRRPCDDDRRKVEYRLTDKGKDLLPTLVALRQWGEKYEMTGTISPVLVDAQDHRPVAPVRVMSHDGRPLTTQDLLWALPEEVEDAKAAE
ncbi:winged helix-turn-helix transcriptional regulator [Sphingomonas yantingensis]|uniref:DNA-binding HxlR family transcriptional regulator n=1 Tax=Sphingomonas yantingensis TaxID=1241761 RepID=A0A7W9AM12_9SPHN|nr:helix-turn-helix domain-containing protein [Sphingomonas yantingensis]MBB5696924.1 DNA-binding HxlR family transcriptional regulator [Sphingomonas yantingensis]